MVGVRALHAGAGPWLLRVRSSSGRPVEVVLRAPTPRIDADMIATNVAALEVALRHALPAPRLLGTSVVAGVPVSVETVVPGASVWPERVGADWFRAAGAAIARVHRVSLAPSDPLPLRARPIAVDDFALDRRLGRMATTPLLARADALVQGFAPSGSVFVHGDVWPGNMLWSDESCQALIDWKTAGVGHPGVDLGELRKQAFFAGGSPLLVLEGWERASGSRASDVAYWDAVAALNTPTESDPPGAHQPPRPVPPGRGGQAVAI
ncbi:Predicted kinase, aminoglycoside phosphotransferase (APT) family [Asanoa hainanensis]|uniref:Predicted kinase, aminoglycoside phosphotransferase (APT) family n=1 Tax=Asanoa hainanensis TaxID=560556 RepID=A0A239P152_9ACTN|nr:Predicted kinase, aminoglycoside phosphotransferase (APT) family [Asanoa hainanensis]